MFPAALLLAAGCVAAPQQSAGVSLSYRDPGIPDIEHAAIQRALADLSSDSTHDRLKAQFYFEQMGPALGPRLVPYWKQLLAHPDPEVRLAAARLIIRFCGRKGVPLLLDFLEWKNEAVRRDAFEKLRLATGIEFEFKYDAPPEERKAEVEDIRRRLGL